MSHKDRCKGGLIHGYVDTDKAGRPASSEGISYFQGFFVELESDTVTRP